MRPSLFFAALLLLSCGSEEGDSLSAVAQEVTFGSFVGERDGLNVTEGIDLDRENTQRRRPGACFQRDALSPDGREGIDNSFAFLFDLVEGFFQEGTVEGIVQGTINEGRLLLMFEVSDVDDWQNDDDVTVSIFLGDGRPDVGPSDRLVPNQTFDRRPDAVPARARGTIRDGVVETESFELSLPMAFFNVFFELNLHDARLRAEVNEFGEWRGVIGGGMTTEDVVAVAEQADMMQEIQVAGVLEGLLPTWTDLAFDEETGLCSQLSVSLVFQTTQAFVFDEAPAP